jgi:hypothetical protein
VGGKLNLTRRRLDLDEADVKLIVDVVRKED